MILHDSGSGTDLSLRSPSSSQNNQDASEFERSVDGQDMTPSTLRARWSYDKMAAVPLVAEAFRAFAWRAMCQESVMFLEEVTK